MPPFRDEHAALLARVTALEEQLASSRADDAETKALTSELRGLSARVNEATERLDDDRAALAEVSAAIDRIRARVGDVALTNANPVASARARGAPRTSPWLLVAAGCVPLVFVIGGAVFALSIHRSKPLPPPTFTPLDAKALLPIARARATQSGMASAGRLESIKAKYVGADGLTRSGPTFTGRVDFVFVDPAPSPTTPSAALPLGAPQPATIRNQYNVSFDDRGADFKGGFPTMLGSEGIADPRCSVASVWAAAIEAGAPRDAIATVEYADQLVKTKSLGLKRAAHWKFVIQSSGFDFEVSISDETCRAIP